MPRSGRVSPAIMLISVVLPAPERPKRAVTPPVAGEARLEREAAGRPGDVDDERHAVSRWRARRASHSEASRAAKAMATAMMVRRSAAISPPGTWV